MNTNPSPCLTCMNGDCEYTAPVPLSAGHALPGAGSCSTPIIGSACHALNRVLGDSSTHSITMRLTLDFGSPTSRDPLRCMGDPDIASATVILQMGNIMRLASLWGVHVRKLMLVSTIHQLAINSLVQMVDDLATFQSAPVINRLTMIQAVALRATKALDRTCLLQLHRACYAETASNRVLREVLELFPGTELPDCFRYFVANFLFIDELDGVPFRDVLQIARLEAL